MIETIELGTGDRVVFVHGDVFDAATTWAAQEPLGEGHRLVLVNRRGFGSSPHVDGEDFDIDAVDVIEVLGSGAHLVGHSYGGVVAMLAAAARPELVRTLAVFEPPSRCWSCQAATARCSTLCATCSSPASMRTGRSSWEPDTAFRRSVSRSTRR